jgi:hypothetical protein
LHSVTNRCDRVKCWSNEEDKRIFNSFIGLKLGKHHFEYQISNAFFEIFDYNEYQDSNIKVNVVLEKKVRC